MKWTILTILFLTSYFGTHASQDADFEDVDALLHRYVRDYGGGGGPLAASGWTVPPKQGQKPAENKPAPAPKSAEKTTQKPTTKAPATPAPTTKAQATTKPTTQKATQPPATDATTRGATAPTKSSKDIKSPGTDNTNGKSGEEIANDIYNHPNECKDPPNGGVWAPLPKGQPCGADGNCPYPQKWCSAKQEGASTSPSMSCQDLPPDCQKVLGSSAATPAPDTTSQAQTTASTTASTSKATQATTKPTTAAAGGSTSAPAGGTTPSSSNCKDNHPYCCFWADDKSGRPSQCDANSGWMKSQCAKSCGTCGCTSGNCPTKVNTAGCQFLPGGQGGQGNKVRIVLGGSPGSSPFGGAGTGFGNGGGFGNGFGNGGGFGGLPSGGQVPPGLTRINLG